MNSAEHSKTKQQQKISNHNGNYKQTNILIWCHLKIMVIMASCVKCMLRNSNWNTITSNFKFWLNF